MTIADVIASRVEGTLADLLLDVFTAGYDAALGNASAPTDEGRADLIALVAARHRDEVLEERGWIDPPVHTDDLPGWLLRQLQQADPVRLRATLEREIALGDALPPAGR